MARSAMYLQCFLAFSTLAVSWALKCGDGAGPSCSSSFVLGHCGTNEACCHDDFNVWCCPQGFKCGDWFHDPGNNTYCMTTWKMSTQSCIPEEAQSAQSEICDQTEYEIIAMDPVGEAKVDQAYGSNLTTCCPANKKCGWSVSETKADSETVSWSETAEVGFNMKWNVEAGPAAKLREIGFEVKNSFQYGQSTPTSSSQSISATCYCTGAECMGPFTVVDFKLQIVTSTQPVTIKASRCGTTKTFSGEVSTVRWMRGATCDVQPHLWSCPPDGRKLRGSVSAPPTHMV